MANKIFNKLIIENFAKQTNEQYVIELIDKCGNLINGAVNEIKSKQLSITNHKLILIDEFATRTISDNSNINLLLSISSAEIEVATNQIIKNKVITSIAIFFNNFKIKFKHKKNKSAKINKEEEKLLNESLYSIFSFKYNLYLLLTKYSPKTTTIIYKNDCISLKDQTEFGKNMVNIYFAIQTDTDNHMIYTNKNSKPKSINLNNRINNFSNQYKKTNGRNIQILKILNCTYASLYKKPLNQIYAESLVFSCNNDIFNKSDSIYDCFLNFVNYVNNINANNIYSINGNKKLFSDELNNVSYMNHLAFINKLKNNI